MPLDRKAPVFVAGHRGMVGSAILRKLESEAFSNLVTRTRAEVDLTDQAAVRDFFERTRPAYVFLAAAKVGGIHANNAYRGDFIRENLQIQTNVIDQAWRAGVQKLLFLGSSCIYPCEAPQPLREDYLLTGPLEPTNEPYAIAKIVGIKLCESYNRQYGESHGIELPQRHAHQPVRPGRQLPPRRLACHSRANSAVSRGQAGQRTQRSHLGLRHPQARVLVCGRHGRRQRLRHEPAES
jgi:hypothetical protein